MKLNESDQFALAVGRASIAESWAVCRQGGPESESGVAQTAAEGEMVATRATTRPGILWRLYQALERGDLGDHYAEELNRCISEVANPETDPAHLGRALAVLAHRYARDEDNGFADFLTAAARDAAAMAA